MFNKKIMILAIVIVSLLAASTVCAADNATDDVVSVDDEKLGEISSFENFEDDEVSQLDVDESVLSSSSADFVSVCDDCVNLTYGEKDYEDVYVESLTGSYGSKNVIKYGWTGNLEGYFKIYKGNDLVYEKELYSNDYDTHDESYDGSKIKSVGTYNAVITDEYGDVLAKATIKINKAKTHTVCPSFSSKIGAKDYIYVGISDVGEKKLYETSGTAKFKIAGKTYTAKFKKGIAYIKIKFPLKAKTYKCSVKFLGNSNYKASSTKFTIKLNKGNVAILKKNRVVKVGKYTVKLTSKQYKGLIKAFNKNKSKKLDFKTKYKHKVKVSYTKTVKKYKTTKCCKTFYAGDYMPTMERMKSAGWKKVSEYTYTKKNPRNKEGIGLSAYTYAVTKWVKTSYKTAYKTKSYPVKAYISYQKSTIMPLIELYSNGKTLTWKYLAIA